MDLITILANEFCIPITKKSQKLWFLRTKSGDYYHDFQTNNFIALGWNLVSPDLITDVHKNREAKKEEITLLYPDEKRPGLILGQLDVFYNQMKKDDLVIIPSSGSKEIAIGKIGEVITTVNRGKGRQEYLNCSYNHKRNVEWLTSIGTWQDIYLFKALRAQQTISDITEEAPLVFRNIFPLYISDDSVHLTFQKRTKENLSLSENVELLSGILQISDYIADLFGNEHFTNHITMKTAAGSPGFIEMIFQGMPITIIAAVFIVKAAIGKTKGADGSKDDGLMALATKVSQLITEHRERQKTCAQTHKIDMDAELVSAQVEMLKAQTAKEYAQIDLIKAQTARENEVARAQALENEQIRLLPSYMTTEEERLQNENLQIPDEATISTVTNAMMESAEKVHTAAARNGLTYDNQKIS